MIPGIALVVLIVFLWLVFVDHGPKAQHWEDEPHKHEWR